MTAAVRGADMGVCELITSEASNQSLRAEGPDKQSQTFRQAGPEPRRHIPFASVISGSIPPGMYKWIEQMVLYLFLQKYSGLHTRFWDKFFFTGTNRCVLFPSCFRIQFPSIYSFYLNKKYTQEGWRKVHHLG